MAELNYTVDVNDAEEKQFEAVPAGPYTVVIEDSDYAPNKQGTGQILSLTYQIIDEGPFKGRKIFENLNLENPSQQAEQIAKRTLNAIGLACGVLDLKDSAQLHNLPMRVEVKVSPPVMETDPVTGEKYEKYPRGNKITKHLKIEEGELPGINKIQSNNTQSTAPQNNAGTTPAKKPWEK